MGPWVMTYCPHAIHLNEDIALIYSDHDHLLFPKVNNDGVSGGWSLEENVNYIKIELKPFSSVLWVL